MRLLPLYLISALIYSTSVMADASSAMKPSGVINIKSHHDVKTTADRLIKVLEKKGMKLFARINHAEGAQNIGKTLRPTELVLFGNPKVGTPLMQCAQSVAIDLPQKALIWEDDKDQVWFSYNDPSYIANRHNIKTCEGVLQKIEKALEKFSRAATKP